MRIRFSIRAVMGFVLLAAVGIAALRSASDLWASTLFSLTLGLLGVASLGTAFGGGLGRASHAGAAAFGWGYMLLAFGPWTAEEVRPHLLTTRLLDMLPGRSIPILTCPDDDTVIEGVGDLNYTGGGGFQRWNLVPLAQPPAHHQRIGHSLFALLMALFGGIVARAFAARSERERSEEV